MLNDSNIILEEVPGRCGSIGGPPCTAYLLIIMDPLNRSVIIYEYDMGCPVPLRLDSSLYFAFMFFSGSEVRPFVNPGVGRRRVARWFSCESKSIIEFASNS